MLDARLSAFLDDELDDDTALTVARHLADCPWCHRELESLRVTREALRQLPALQAPVLRAETWAAGGLRAWSRRTVATAGLAAATLALLVVVYVVGGGTGEVVPSVEPLPEHLARTTDSSLPAPIGGLAR